MKQELVDGVVKMLTKPDVNIPKMVDWTKKFEWDKIASSWNDVITL